MLPAIVFVCRAVDGHFHVIVKHTIPLTLTVLIGLSVSVFSADMAQCAETHRSCATSRGCICLPMRTVALHKHGIATMPA